MTGIVHHHHPKEINYGSSTLEKTDSTKSHTMGPDGFFLWVMSWPRFEEPAGFEHGLISLWGVVWGGEEGSGNIK